MKRHCSFGLVLGLFAFSVFPSAPRALADDIDEILKIERMTEQDLGSQSQPAPAGAGDSVAPPAQPSTETLSLVEQIRAKDAELQRARTEIAHLKQALVEQEQRHQLALQRSYYNMGCVYKAARQFPRAETEFLKALAINPNDAGVHFNLGILYDDDLNQKAKARDHYRKFLELAPDDRDAPLVKEWLSTLSD